MRKSAPVWTAVIALLFCLPVFAQTPVPTEDPGVSRAVLIDRPDVRVLRVEIQPGATRRIHKHDDVKFHLFLPLTEGVELTVGAKTTPAPRGQAYFMEKGTPHGFRNTGTSVAMAFEVFVKEGAAAADQRDGLGLALALAAIGQPSKQ